MLRLGGLEVALADARAAVAEFNFEVTSEATVVVCEPHVLPVCRRGLSQVNANGMDFADFLVLLTHVAYHRSVDCHLPTEPGNDAAPAANMQP